MRKRIKEISSSESQHWVSKSNHKAKQICFNWSICEPDPKDKRQRKKDFEDKFQFFVVRPMAELGGGGTCDRWDAINATFTSKPIQTLFFCFSRLCLLVDQVWERRFWKLTYLQKIAIVCLVKYFQFNLCFQTNSYVLFLAVQNSSIGDLVSH